jgi:membrane associated rhomboid family serine protease
MQDAERYRAIFAFDRDAVMAGQVWRLFTFQFVQGSFLGSPALSLFFTLLIAYIMGSAVEEEWGTFDFVTLLLLSNFGSAVVAFALDLTVLGSFAISYSLLFVFATIYPDQVFYIFFVLPMKVRWLGYIAAALLLFGAVMRSPDSLAALGGALLSYGWFLWRFRPGMRVPRPRKTFVPPAPVATGATESTASKNLARFSAMKEALASGSNEKVEALASSIRPDIVPGVNICPPVDYKPENEDGYCVRCEGFAECSVRYLGLKTAEKADG